MMTRLFNIFVDDMTNDNQLEPGQVYQIALAPSALQGSSLATKRYFSDAQLTVDLLGRLNYSTAAVNRFFAGEGHDVLANFPLSEEDADFLGWHPEYDRFQ